jgi:two-component system, LytTR family, response regulator
MRYKAIIIDDEAPARAIIREFLKNHPNVSCAGECMDGFEGARAIQQHKPDLVFLDIQMPRINGLEMLEILDPDSLPSVIFVTAHDDYALKAFELNAVDYLLKPLARDRFDQALVKALERMQQGRGNQDQVMGMMESGAAGRRQWLDRIVVRSGSEIHLVPEEEILCVEAQDDYVLVCTRDEEFLKKKTLKYYEGKLDPEYFLRVHRSFIVRFTAIQRIEAYSKDAYLALLKNGRKISVSKQGYAALKRQFDF